MGSKSISLGGEGRGGEGGDRCIEEVKGGEGWDREQKNENGSQEGKEKHISETLCTAHQKKVQNLLRL